MLSIVGGTYYENCRFPFWDELNGSGLRACKTLSNFGENIEFYTCLNDKTKPIIADLLSHEKIKINAYRINHLIEFYYLHGLSRPSIINSPDEIIRDKLELELAVVFGMIEAKFDIVGRKLVFDPQRKVNKSDFLEYNFCVDSLVLVLNKSEAIYLSGKSKVQDAGLELLNLAEAVIIKDGPRGAIVFTSGKSFEIPAFQTQNVFNIGSGDIFTAVFSYYWLIRDLDLHKSAMNASKATALHSNNISFTKNLDSTISNDFCFEPIYGQKQISNAVKYDIYLAGPFFDISQYWFVSEVRKIFTSLGFNIFSPIHDVGTGQMKEIATKDLEALNNSRILFVIADGLDLGTFFEVGYARALNIPVVIFSSLPLNHNETMLTGTDCTITHDITTSIYKTIWKLVE